MRKILILVILFLSLTNAANNAGAFLDNYQSARAQGMGNAFSAVADDASAVFYNPAGIAKQNGSSFQLQSKDIWEVKYLVLAGSFSYENNKYGFGALNADLGGIKEAALDNNGDPYFTGKTFSWTGQCFYLSTAREIVSQNYLGATLKLINEQMYGYQEHGYGLDLGYLYKYSNELNFSVVLENAIRPNLYWNTESNTKETVPLNIHLGSAYKQNENLLYTLELTKKDERDAELHAGAEYWFIKQNNFGFGIRGGLEPRVQNLGLTIQINNINFDYSYSNYEYTELGQVNKVAVGYKL